MVIIGLILLFWVALQTDYVQNKLVSVATKKLSKALNTEVSIKHVSLAFFNSLNMEGTLVRDNKKDTLLYAGKLKVRITDWFFVKDKIELKYIGLEDATVYINRKTPVWNYQFIADYFASPKTKKEKQGNINLDLKKIDFKNLYFVSEDLWVGTRMTGKLGSLLLDADNINIDQKSFIISNLEIDKPYFAMDDLDGLRPDSLKPKKKQSIDTGLLLNPANLSLRVANLKLTNGTFINNADQDVPLPHFDGTHLFFSKINGVFKDVILNKDTLTTRMDMTCKERSGLDVKKFKADFKVTPKLMEFAKLDLQTNKSHVGNYYAMRCNSFVKDYSSFITNVVMDAKFKQGVVHSDDIAFFAPQLKSWNKQVTLSGNFKGTVADFDVKDLYAKDGKTSTSLMGNLSMKGLPDIDKTVINLTNGTAVSNYNDLSTFIPIIKTITEPNLAALGNLIYRGNFNGTIHDFITSGNISTNLGSVTTNINMKLPSGADPSYIGKITTNRFNIGKFLNNSKLGLVDFDGKIAGSSFTMDRLKTSLDGTIKKLQFNDYDYVNITTKGTFQKKYFTGEVKVDDPNFYFVSNVEIDLSQAKPKFNILGDLGKSNFKNLNFTKDNLELTGLFDVNFSGTNIDNFLGQAKLLNATVKNDNINISFDSLNLTSAYYKDTVKYLRLATNDFNANIWGEFSILDLPVSFQSFLHKYYPAYINEPSSIPKNQNFSVSVNTLYVDPYLKLIDKRLSGLNDARLKGTIDTRKNLFTADISVPFVQYDNYTITGASIQGNGTLDSLTLTGDIASIQLSKSFNLPNTKINIHSANDHSVVAIKTTANNTFSDADLFADVYTLEDGVRLKFRPSSFLLNEKKWNLEKEGEIVVRKSFVDAKNVKFSQGYQEITVETQAAEDSNINDLNLNLKNVVLGDLTSMFVKDIKFEGITTGKVVMHDFFNEFTADAKLRVEQFRVDEDSLGLVDVKASYDNKTGDIAWDVVSPNEKYNFTAVGRYKTKIKDSTVEKPLSTIVKLNNARISLVQRFLKGIFSDVDGYASGELEVSGDPNAPDLLGKVKLRNGTIKVDYTQVTYNVDSANISFDKDGIDFGTLTILDKYKNKGLVKGKLYEKNFKNMVFDFDVSSNKLLLIDTKAKDNPQLFGNAIGKASLSFKGPESNCKMTITGEANEPSHITIPNSISRESSDADYIVFKQYGSAMEAAAKKSNFNISVDLDVTANNFVDVDVILDDLTGDVIKATGNGRLRINVSNGNIAMKGRYNIEKGSYDFNFQSFIRKPFELLPDQDNYIEWNGDPLKANIHIDARYTANRVSPADLVSNQQSAMGFSSAVRSYRDDVYVIAQLRNKLDKPSIKFKIDFPQNSPIKTDATFSEFLARIASDDNEMLSQATSLIVFNSFAPYGQGLLGSNAGLGSFVSSTISQQITAVLNKQVSNVLYKLFRDKSLRFDVGASVYSSSSILNNGLVASTGNRIDRSVISAKIGKSFFNDNVIVTFGSDFDFNLGSSAAQSGNFQWLPDVNIEIVLSQSNHQKLLAVVFNKNSLDISGNTLGRRNRQGFSISYRKDFDTILGSSKPSKAPDANKEQAIEFSTPKSDSTKTSN